MRCTHQEPFASVGSVQARQSPAPQPSACGNSPALSSTRRRPVGIRTAHFVRSARNTAGLCAAGSVPYYRRRTAREAVCPRDTASTFHPAGNRAHGRRTRARRVHPSRTGYRCRRRRSETPAARGPTTSPRRPSASSGPAPCVSDRLLRLLLLASHDSTQLLVPTQRRLHNACSH